MLTLEEFKVRLVKEIRTVLDNRGVYFKDGYVRNKETHQVPLGDPMLEILHVATLLALDIELDPKRQLDIVREAAEELPTCGFSIPYPIMDGDSVTKWRPSQFLLCRYKGDGTDFRSLQIRTYMYLIGKRFFDIKAVLCEDGGYSIDFDRVYEFVQDVLTELDKD